MFPECSLNVPCVFPECSLNAHLDHELGGGYGDVGGALAGGDGGAVETRLLPEGAHVAVDEPIVRPRRLLHGGIQ
eukprot:8876123-Pyramimonas_sp.AAC.1